MKKFLLVFSLFSLNTSFALPGNEQALQSFPRPSAAVVTGAVLGAGLGGFYNYTVTAFGRIGPWSSGPSDAELKKAAMVGMAVGAGVGATIGGIANTVFGK